jgi:hypothetical protein
LLEDRRRPVMPRGMYRDSGGWVQVNFDDKFQMSMHRSDYEDRDYKPPFESLPTRDKYAKAKGAKKTTRASAAPPA